MNASGTLRYALGGAWDESSYVFSIADARDPFWRTVSMGFRTVKRPTPPPPASFAPLTLQPPQGAERQAGGRSDIPRARGSPSI